jgi:hypothetical protein
MTRPTNTTTAIAPQFFEANLVAAQTAAALNAAAGG